MKWLQALKIILEEIYQMVEEINHEAAQAFKKPEYKRVHELLNKGEQILSFRKGETVCQRTPLCSEKGLLGKLSGS